MQEGVADSFYAKLKARMDKLRVGSPLDKSIDVGAIACRRGPATVSPPVAASPTTSSTGRGWIACTESASPGGADACASRAVLDWTRIWARVSSLVSRANSVSRMALSAAVVFSRATSIEFTEVSLDYSPETEVPWTVNADSATILPVEQRVQLRGHVRAISTQGSTAGDTEIRTQYLELDPERYIAETEERVQIRIGARSLTATGMLASLNDSKVVLKSNVRGKIAP